LVLVERKPLMVLVLGLPLFVVLVAVMVLLLVLAGMEILVYLVVVARAILLLLTLGALERQTRERMAGLVGLVLPASRLVAVEVVLTLPVVMALQAWVVLVVLV
jgi:hypothetical protein